MSAVIRRNPISPLTELFDWYNSGGWPETADWPHGGAHALRIEDRLEQDRYVVRAEIPGVDPDKDVQITVDDGVLTISAERHEEVLSLIHISEPTRRTPISYAVFCLQKKKN